MRQLPRCCSRGLYHVSLQGPRAVKGGRLQARRLCGVGRPVHNGNLRWSADECACEEDNQTEDRGDGGQAEAETVGASAVACTVGTEPQLLEL
jgi:hypothetical protein